MNEAGLDENILAETLEKSCDTLKKSLHKTYSKLRSDKIRSAVKSVKNEI